MEASRSQGSPFIDVFLKLDKLIKSSQFLLIHLFFNLIPDPCGPGELDIAKSLLDIKGILNGKKTYRDRAIPILQYVLELVEVSGSHSGPRDLKSTEKQLETCRNEFAYASVIVKVCMDLDETSFKQLKRNVCVDHLRSAQDNFQSCADLCLNLHRCQKISQSDLNLLKKELTRINRNDIANAYVANFIKSGCYDTSACNQLSRSQQETVRENIDDVRNGGKTVLTEMASPVDHILSSALSAGDQNRDNMEFSGKHKHPIPVQRRRRPDPSPSQVDIPEPKGTSGGARCFNRCYWLLAASTILVLVLFVLIIVFSALYGSRACQYTAVYARSGDTIIVTTVKDPLNLTQSSISECPTTGDFPHTSQLYLVKENNIVYRQRLGELNFTTFNRSDSDCNSNLLFDSKLSVVYMLVNSTIQFKICLTADSYHEPPEKGTLLIFDNNDDFEERVSDDVCPLNNRAALVHNLNIGNPEQFECTSVTYRATINGYHYIVAKTPGNVQFYYKYSYKQLYLDSNDFNNLVCTFSSNGGTKCDHIDASKPVYLVVYIEPNVEDNGVSTHICFESQWTIELIALIACLAVSAVTFIIIVVLCIAANQYRKNRKNRGEFLLSK